MEIDNRRDPLTPTFFKVESIQSESADIYTLELQPPKSGFSFLPGQFNMLYAFGAGESAISISGSQSKANSLVHTIRQVGSVTKLLTTVKKGDQIGVRGPFGRPWPLEECEGHDVVILAGGIGLAPLRPVIYQILENRDQYGQVHLLYGARNPQDIIFEDELESWASKINVEVTVDSADKTWRGHVGVVTNLLNFIELKTENTKAMLCGPDIMMRFSVNGLMADGVDGNNIFVSLERNMKCAVAHCGHCQLGPHFVCKDGPVFSYSEIETLFGLREF